MREEWRNSRLHEIEVEWFYEFNLKYDISLEKLIKYKYHGSKT